MFSLRVVELFLLLASITILSMFVNETDIGKYALIAAFYSLINTGGLLRIDFALLHRKTPSTQLIYALVWIAILISIAFVVISVLLVINVDTWYKVEYVIAGGLYIFFSLTSRILKVILVVQGKYVDGTKGTVLLTLSTVALQLVALPYFDDKLGVIIYIQSVSSIVPFYYFFRKQTYLKGDKLFTHRFRSPLTVISRAVSYSKDYIRYQVPGVFVNNAYRSYPIYILPILVDYSASGYFFLAHRIAQIPIKIFSEAVSDIISRSLVDASSSREIIKIIIRFALIGTVLSATVLFFARLDVTSLILNNILSDKFETVFTVFEIIIVGHVASLIVSPLIRFFSVMKYEKFYFILQIFYLMTVLSLFFSLAPDNIVDFSEIYTYLMVVFYSIVFIFILIFAYKKKYD